MNSEILTFVAELRKNLGTGASRSLRKKGMIPATVYGNGAQPMSIAIKEKEITKHYRRPQYISRLIQLNIDQKQFYVLPKAIDIHPITEIVRHADFIFLAKNTQKMDVPIVYVGKEKCVGIKRGGYFNVIKRTINLLCPVNNLLRKIEVDVSHMLIGTSMKMSQISLPKEVKVTQDLNCVIASIIGKKGQSDDIENDIDNNTVLTE